MTEQASDLLTQALRLPAADRVELASRLFDSLDETMDEDAEAAWSAEIKTRVEELDSGQVQAIPWSQARRMILEDTDDAQDA